MIKSTTTPKSALRSKFLSHSANRACDAKGYVRYPYENLIPGIGMKDFEDDLLDGDGDELRSKFCAIHSSSALVVNTFACFKLFPTFFQLFGEQGLQNIRFEKKFPIFEKSSRHTSEANLDAFIERSSA